MNAEFKFFLVVAAIALSFIGIGMYNTLNNKNLPIKKENQTEAGISREYFEGHYYILFFPILLQMENNPRSGLPIKTEIFPIPFVVIIK